MERKYRREERKEGVRNKGKKRGNVNFHLLRKSLFMNS